ncbi:hypothetical protein NDU88_006818 [Pleurodeles waltl]|uniref:Uncharacterized protein n=1 Tax=Pleurodeles waltl TaxID=8319 RepID=A0AAV7SQL7_PLEWA|nr:hypothetical protein NDU88_006818 [Pleurodeles waltl]
MREYNNTSLIMCGSRFRKFNKCKLVRAQKKADLENAGTSNEGADEKQQRDRLSQTKKICIFCTASEGDLHEVMTLDADKNIRHMATDLQEKEAPNLLKFDGTDDATALLASLEELDEEEPSTEVNVWDLVPELVLLEEIAETDVPTSNLM